MEIKNLNEGRNSGLQELEMASSSWRDWVNTAYKYIRLQKQSNIRPILFCEALIQAWDARKKSLSKCL